jgi:translation initiation factor 2B subunit (eIF-2B alpha/beta/delta family)
MRDEMQGYDPTSQPVTAPARELLARINDTTADKTLNDLLRELYHKSKTLDEAHEELASLATHVDGLMSEVERLNAVNERLRVELAARDVAGIRG